MKEVDFDANFKYNVIRSNVSFSTVKHMESEDDYIWQKI